MSQSLHSSGLASLFGRAPRDEPEGALQRAWRAAVLWQVDGAAAALATAGTGPSAARQLVKGKLLHRQGALSAAVEALQRGLELSEGDEDGPRLACMAQVELAQLHHQLGDRQAASALLASADHSSSALPQLRPRWLLARAQLDAQQGHSDGARERLERALALSVEQGDGLQQVATLQALAALSNELGALREAGRLAASSLKLADRHEDPQRRSAAELLLGRVRVQQGEASQARSFARASLEGAERIGDRRTQGAALQLLAELAQRDGKSGQAQRLLQRSIDLLTALGDRRGRAAALHELAILHHQRGQPERARALLAEVIDETRAMGDQQGQAASLHQLAQVELKAGRHPRARALLQQSLSVLEALGNRQGRAASMVMLGQLDARDGQLEQGIARLTQAVDELQELGSDMAGPARALLQQLQQQQAQTQDFDPIRSLLELAASSLQAGQAPKAQQAADQALHLSRKAGRPGVEAAAHFLLGRAWLAMGEPGRAMPSLMMASVLLKHQGRADELAEVQRLIGVARSR